MTNPYDYKQPGAVRHDFLPATPLSLKLRPEWLPIVCSLWPLVHQATPAGRKLVHIFDDFEILTQNREIALGFFAYLRSLANNYEVALLIASCDVPWQACRREALSSAPLFNIFTTPSRHRILRCLTKQLPGSWSKAQHGLWGVLEHGSFVCCIVILDLRERRAEAGTGGYDPTAAFQSQ